ncbi:MAG: class I SAM-dependent methyltransferase [Veillonellaceae bacterium]|nr:class I SAM-dependent methyltransferase [Veillonellaceae bacterium]
MESEASIGMSDFNRIAEQYEDLVDQSLPKNDEFFQGSDHAYFNEYKLRYLRPVFCKIEATIKRPLKLLDYGCGTGIFSEVLADAFPQYQIHGFDIAEKSIEEVPESLLQHEGIRFTSSLMNLDEDYDIALLVTVLHHVSLDERNDVFQNILSRLRPGGRLIIIEHNMKNPVTRNVVRRCVFDQDAEMLTRRETVRLLRNAGFKNLQSRYIVFFPKRFAEFRWMDRFLKRVPMGAQFMAMGCKGL